VPPFPGVIGELRVLTADMGMNVALPYRISVHEDGGQT
jgi:hypothetical protein